jgi:hypothetical protein
VPNRIGEDVAITSGKVMAVSAVPVIFLNGSPDAGRAARNSIRSVSSRAVVRGFLVGFPQSQVGGRVINAPQVVGGRKDGQDSPKASVGRVAAGPVTATIGKGQRRVQK